MSLRKGERTLASFSTDEGTRAPRPELLVARPLRIWWLFFTGPYHNPARRRISSARASEASRSFRERRLLIDGACCSRTSSLIASRNRAIASSEQYLIPPERTVSRTIPRTPFAAHRQRLGLLGWVGSRSECSFRRRYVSPSTKTEVGVERVMVWCPTWSCLLYENVYILTAQSSGSRSPLRLFRELPPERPDIFRDPKHNDHQLKEHAG